MGNKEATTTQHFAFARKGLFWCCFGSVFFYMLGTWVIRESIDPIYQLIPYQMGDLNTLIVIAMAAFVIIASYYKPALLNPRIGIYLSVALIIVGLVLICFGAAETNVVAVTAGLVFNYCGKTFGTYTMGMVLCRMGHTRDAAIALSGGIVVSCFVRAALPHFSPAVGYFFFACIPLAILACSYTLAAPMIKRISLASPLSQLSPTNPASFIGPFNRLFVCIFMFSLARGFGGTFDGPTINVLLSFSGAGALLVAVVAIFGSDTSREDTLFVASGAIVVAGFLLAPVSSSTNSGITSSVLACGWLCFNILMWLSLAAVAGRNPLAALVVFALGSIASSLGTVIGSWVGNSHITPMGFDTDTFYLLIALLVFIFVMFLWIVMRNFSFAETIRGIHSVRKVEPIGVQGVQFDHVCESLSKDFGLTPREAEVFVLLARGRNSQFIQDSLVISRNTAKTHIKHIYQKADVHSQQDLIDMVVARLE